MRLGEVQEHLESYAAAYVSYAYVAQADPSHVRVFSAVLRLHRGAQLPRLDHQAAWKTLRDYTGKDDEIVSYVDKMQREFAERRLKYCRGCGHQGQLGETACSDCGRLLGEKEAAGATLSSNPAAQTSPASAPNDG